MLTSEQLGCKNPILDEYGCLLFIKGNYKGGNELMRNTYDKCMDWSYGIIQANEFTDKDLSNILIALELVDYVQEELKQDRPDEFKVRNIRRVFEDKMK